jgi:hypothetical protein
MKNIAVFDSIDHRNFIGYVQSILDMVDIKYSIIDSGVLNQLTVDYAICNSGLERQKLDLKAGCCLVNMDYKHSCSLAVGGNTVTYGFGTKNTVTVSSLEENNLEFVYCLQRYLTLKNGGELEPQEIPVRLQFSGDTELYASMAAITIALIEGVSISEIDRKLNKKVLILS